MRFPSLSIPRRPEVPLTGLSRLATHAIVFSGILLYHNPKYLLLELPGLKKPRAKSPPLEINTSPSLIELFLVIRSVETHTPKRTDDTIKLRRFLGQFMTVISAQ
ncbi:hypothetical protein BT93_L0014 [Corymbia citriodora subsp. variegata]|uniref:Uncharacterized protein n=1 Tax=Corymbia citriodora subsp. variegata TaxID=360336 RepID=A0A8T0CS60_CORYI|nr:hypothetical protein BT93_L0014 [Corymbia citriodora subsp. variegata]